MEKLTIGICDDEEIILNHLGELVEEIAGNMRLECEILLFSSGELLLQQAGKLELVFLDIEMPGLDGIETGRNIHLKHPECQIVMATSMVERFKEAFRIHAFRFITKPFVIEEIEEALRAFLEQRAGLQTISVSLNRNTCQVRQRDIRCVLAYGSYVEVMAQGKIFRKECSMEEMEQILDADLFFRIHREYLVNMLWIERYKNGVITLDGQELSVSRRKKKEFEQAYLEFDLHYRR